MSKKTHHKKKSDKNPLRELDEQLKEQKKVFKKLRDKLSKDKSE
ncbi:hypothetical protein [Urechidicola vernalis]|uniref:Uncharacterized protein n=1 Tax=Urechidicola vernalis TaxID=3075600 RepID=A0ABU2Y1T6_9FLAO|nr:hypothetical protein [Urechidicola sp. P050]MDT0552106.1 hypothetical protein [Urechidicola sp. P050]